MTRSLTAPRTQFIHPIFQFLIALSGLNVLVAVGSAVGTTLPPERIDLTSFLLIATIILLVLSNNFARLQPYQWLLLATICITSGIILSQLRLIENSPQFPALIVTFVLASIIVSRILPLSFSRITRPLGLMLLICSWTIIALSIFQMLLPLIAPMMLISIACMMCLFYDLCRTLWTQNTLTKPMLIQACLFLIGISAYGLMMS